MSPTATGPSPADGGAASASGSVTTTTTTTATAAAPQEASSGAASQKTTTAATATGKGQQQDAAVAALGTSTAALSLGGDCGGKATASPERAGCKRQRDGDEGASSSKIRGVAAAGGTRRGKWSAEEEAFAARLIRDFDAGLLQLENGATLRAFLSKKLNCSAMRISKKFAGEKCLGKQIFLRRSGVDEEQLREEHELLAKLESAFLASISSTAPPRQPTPPPVVSRNASSAEPSSASEDDDEAPLQQHQQHHQQQQQKKIEDKARSQARGKLLDLSKSSPLTLSKLKVPALPEHVVVEPDEKPARRHQAAPEQPAVAEPVSPEPAPPRPSDDQAWREPAERPERLLEQLEGRAAFAKSFCDLGPQTPGFVGREARELAEELVDAHRRANKHKSTSFADLPKADTIQSPPAALMLELGPTPRRLPHPTIGAYAFSIARGTSNSSLQRLADEEAAAAAASYDDDPTCFFDDAFDDALDIESNSCVSSRRNSFSAFAAMVVDDDAPGDLSGVQVAS
mmetsp:Transcript_7871/g.24148  ORF Transcript_7871/g.24148 Transcript_7871/m.24148 type:complete len:514 (+) Transcript_7871:127-1668(+)